jgi:hypothetical protein
MTIEKHLSHRPYDMLESEKERGCGSGGLRNLDHHAHLASLLGTTLISNSFGQSFPVMNIWLLRAS